MNQPATANASKKPPASVHGVPLAAVAAMAARWED